MQPLLLTFGESEQEVIFLWVKVPVCVGVGGRGVAQLQSLPSIRCFQPLLTLSRCSLPCKTSSKNPGLARVLSFPHLLPFIKHPAPPSKMPCFLSRSRSTCQWDVGVHMVREEGGTVLDAANSSVSVYVCMCVQVPMSLWVQKPEPTVVSFILQFFRS